MTAKHGRQLIARTAPLALAAIIFSLSGCDTVALDTSPGFPSYTAVPEFSDLVRDPEIALRVRKAANALYPDIPVRDRETQWRISPPRYVSLGSAEYPPTAHVRNGQGIVWVAFVLDQNGVPQRVQWVPEETGSYELDFRRAAIATVQQCRLTPATLDGAPIATVQVIPFVFALDAPGVPQVPSVEQLNEVAAEHDVMRALLHDYQQKHPDVVAAMDGSRSRGHAISPPRPKSQLKYGYPEKWSGRMEKIWVTAVIETDGHVSFVECKADPATPDAFTHAEFVRQQVLRWKFWTIRLEDQPTAGTDVFPVVTDGKECYLRSPDVF